MSDAANDEDSIAHLAPGRVVGVPDAIWLNVGEVPDGVDTDFEECGEVTWCDQPQEASDVKYVLFDLAQQEIALKDAEIAALQARLDRLKPEAVR